MNLSEVRNNTSAYITRVKGRGAFRKRIMEMGFVKGKKVTALKNAPLKDPIEYRIMGYNISLRRSEAQLIEVITREELSSLGPTHTSNGILSEEEFKSKAVEKGKTIHIALVGNPNSGKTSLYNFASHSREHVGNYGGVTVDSREARFMHKGYSFRLTDLPGTYSLSAYTPEELFVRKYIFGEMPDLVINVVDATNLERNLYFTTQLIDMDLKVIIALNMYDELEKSGDVFDWPALGKLMGTPIVPTVGSRGKGIAELFDKAIEVFEDREPVLRHIHIHYGNEVEKSISTIQTAIRKNRRITDKVSSRYYAIKLLENDQAADFTLSRWEFYNEIRKTADSELKRLKTLSGEEAETLITDARYGFISGALKETFTRNPVVRKRNSEVIDTFLTHKVFGLPLLFLILFITFYATFKVGNYPMVWLENLVSILTVHLHEVLPPGPLTDLMVNGVLGGVGAVIVFLPNILILFYFISLLEDTGYLARAAFIMDRVMHKIGLHGRSFIPLLMGFGCNVPAIMASRTIKNRNNRLLTILINPFMSCSARLPVYILITGAFFPHHAGLVLFLLYFFGIVMAALVAILFKKTLFKSEEVPFVMELPPYRLPTFRSSLLHMWNKGAQYLQKMGGVILVASVLIWGLSYYPSGLRKSTFPTQESSSFSAIQPNGPGAVQKPDVPVSSEEAKIFENSYIARLGKFIEPVMKPLGFDWKMSVSILTGIAAKEVVVSTMGVLYQSEPDKDNETTSLINKLKEEKYTSGKLKGKPVFNQVVAGSYLLFILLYFPCVAVIAAIKKESGSWKWALFAALYTTSLAWIISFLFYQTGKLLFL